MTKLLLQHAEIACLSWILTLSIPASGQCAVTEALKLKSNAPRIYEQLGWGVSLDGIRAIASGYRSDGIERDGAAYLFDLTTGAQLHKLTQGADVLDQRYGISSGISGNRAIVGASFATGKAAKSGAAYVYDVSTGSQLFKLMANDGATDDLFGEAVAIDGNIALIGASRDSADAALSGSAYLFDATTGQQLRKLTARFPGMDDQFGISVAIRGNRAVIGAYGDVDARGASYIFDVATGQQLFKLTADDGVSGDLFGVSVGIDGNTVIVGAPGDDSHRGSAYLFDISTGQQLFKLVQNDRDGRDDFGQSVDVNGIRAIVGAPEDNQAGVYSGSAYLFDTRTGIQLAKLIGSDSAANDRFGRSTAIRGNTAVVGAFLHNFEDFPAAGFQAGEVYVFVVPEPGSVIFILFILSTIAMVRFRRAAIH